MVLAHLMQALSASRPRSEWYTRHPDKLLCNENIDEVPTLRLWLLLPTGLYGFYCPLVSNVVHSSTTPPILASF